MHATELNNRSFGASTCMPDEGCKIRTKAGAAGPSNKYLLNKKHVNKANFIDQTLDKFLLLSDTIVTLSGGSSKPQCRRAWELALKVNDWDSGIGTVNTFLQYLRRRGSSESTKNTYCFHLYKICKCVRVEVEELIKMEKEKREELVNKYVIDLIKKERSLKYIKNAIDALRAYFKANNEKFEVIAPRIPPRYSKRDEYIPTPTEALEMANAVGSLRDKAMILLMAFSGLRVSTLLALRYRDVRDELEKGFENICIEVYPRMKEVVKEACKGNVPYYTFAIKKTTEILRRYIEERKEVFGEINDNELLFCTNYNRINRNSRRFEPLKKRAVERIVKRAAQYAGIKRWKDVTPHTLRKTFQSFMRGQPESTRLDVRDQEFLFGHILGGSMDYYYDRGKKEDLRQKFSKMIIENNPISRAQKLIAPEEVEKYLSDGWIVVTFINGLNKVVVEKNF